MQAERKVENFATYIADMSLLRPSCERYVHFSFSLFNN